MHLSLLSEFCINSVADEDIGGGCVAFFDCSSNAKCIGETCVCQSGSTDISGFCVDGL